MELHGSCLEHVSSMCVSVCALIWKMWCGYYCYSIYASALGLHVIVLVVAPRNNGKTKKYLFTFNMQTSHCLLAQMSILLTHFEENEK